MQRASYVDLPGGTLHAVDTGGSKPLMVLVHGLGASHTSYRDIIQPLAADHRVVALDLPGFGLSPPIAHHDLDHLSASVVEAIEHLGGPAALVGNSMGGLVSELVAARRPDLVSSLVVIAPASPAWPPTSKADRHIALRLGAQSLPGVGHALLHGLRAALTPREQTMRVLEIVSSDVGDLSPATVEASVAVAETRRSLPWSIDATIQATASVRRMLYAPGRFARMVASIPMRALILSGRHDRVVPSSAIRRLADLRPDWEWHEHPDVGHVPQMERPEWTIERIGRWVGVHGA